MDDTTKDNSAGKPIRCRAAVVRKAGEPLVIEEVIVAPPKSGEVRLKIICTSLCYSDVTFWKLNVPPAYFPRILGHEAVGVIESIGEGVSEFAKGDTVIPIFMPDCKECRDCKSKKSNLCTKYPFQVSPWLHDGTSRFTDLNGETIYHLLFVSSFAEYTVVDVANITKIDPATIPPNRACLLSCGVSTVRPNFIFPSLKWKLSLLLYSLLLILYTLSLLLYSLLLLLYTLLLLLYHYYSYFIYFSLKTRARAHGKMNPGRREYLGVGAALKSAKVKAGSTVAIFGLGSIGLAVAEGARLCGAARVIGVDVNPDKAETSKAFGVTDFVNSRDCGDKSVSQIIIEMTDGGADYCFECVGMASLVEEAYASSRKGWGKTTVLGVDKPGSKVALTSLDVLYQGKTLHGSLFGGLKPKSDIHILIQRYMDKELELDKFVTHEVNFEQINEAFDLLIQGKSLRCVIWMDK